MARVKLFSSSAPTIIRRRKLFCAEEENPGTTVLECADCGYKFETTAHTTSQICPRCGGLRFNVVRTFFSNNSSTPEPVEEAAEGKQRVGLYSTLPGEEEAFQKTFSETTDEFELKLKEFSGKTFKEEDIEKTFGCTSDELLDKGFAEVNDNGDIHVLDTAFMQSRLFSKILVKVTKVFELDPEVVGAYGAKKEAILDSLEDKISPRGVIVLKKAHGFDTVKAEDDWAKTSGIINDLPLEFGGSERDYEGFKKIIDTRYPDAPEGIMDLLKNRGVISISGNTVRVLK